jgi:SAM-dependent methyltransferase
MLCFAMNRNWTNRLRYVLDECLPPILRDSRWFMWPLFVLAYRRFDVGEFMDFKQRAWSMNDAEYERFYAQLQGSISRRRATDLNEDCLHFIANWALTQESNLEVLDVGSAHGYLLKQLHTLQPGWSLHGVDVALSSESSQPYRAHRGLLPNLPFADQQFDWVLCTHVLEHVPNLPAATRELQRIARQGLIIVVPRQRYYRYTLDEHLNFFSQIEPLVFLFGSYLVTVHELHGDWLLLVDLLNKLDT